MDILPYDATSSKELVGIKQFTAHGGRVLASLSVRLIGVAAALHLARRGACSSVLFFDWLARLWRVALI